ncbi:tetratricopeptide repeat protein [Nocardia sp. NBC_00565]|uniref:tetratricopeptide repeat protein n=1 Tax=Nocardia sp. NBC_00565 TaxID=2975993 RepID=UPI002E8159C9|nr:tetratricopeptide repeat protein [Nocardia sp. NBC_00565]WUC01311.1 tetratricopeptide repeat protein [Nocardia sp. NBC_00565]
MDRAGRKAGPRPAGTVSAEDRRRLRDRLADLGLTDHQLLEPFAAELRQRGYRPRAAWRYANELTQGMVAERYNELTDNAKAAMKASRISEYEAWPFTRDGVILDGEPQRPYGVRPTVRVLKNLATIYGTTWDQLVDVADLAHMPEHERLEYHQALARRSIGRLPVPAGGDLPAEVPHFTGRDGPKSQLHDRVTDHLRSGAVAVHVIDGLTGIGKTALARYAVAAFGRHYPDGTIWVDLHGYTLGRDPREPIDVLEQLLLQVGVARETIEMDLAGRANRWRTTMSERRMLIVFDNVLDTAQVKDLLPQAPGCFVLITSRSKLTGLAGAAPLRLEVMEWDEAEELLVKLGNLRDGYDKRAVRQILETAGRLPLAIRLIGGQIAHHGADMLADSAADIANLTARMKEAAVYRRSADSAAEHLFDQFAAEDESLAAAFEMSYQRLQDPEQQRAVRLLGWFPGPEITAEAMATMASVPLGDGMMVVRRLFEAGFLDPASGGPGGRRYRMHDLTRWCARMHAEREDSPAEHAAVIDRLVHESLAVARRASTHQIFDPAGSEHLWNPSEDATQARAWLTREREMLQGCVQAAEPSTDAAELARRLASHLSGTGQWSLAHRLFGRALTIAGQVRDRGAESWALVGRGRVDRLMGHHEAASAGFEQAVAIARELGDRHTEVAVLCELGQAVRSTGDHARARDYFDQALELARAIGNRPTECDALQGRAQVARAASDYRTARLTSEEALRIADDIGDPVRVATAQWGLAEVIRRLGEQTEAKDLYSKALGIAKDMNHRKLEGDALRGLGHIERLVGEQVTARRYFEEALSIARHIHDRYGEGWTLWGLGNIARKAGDYEKARRMFQQAYDIAVEIDDPFSQVDTLRGLGHIERHFGEYRDAQRYYEDSQHVARRIGDPLGQADALRGRATVAVKTGQAQLAEQLLSQALVLYESTGVRHGEQIASEIRMRSD